MQIRARLTLQFILVVASILVVSLFAIYYFSEKNRENRFYNQLRKKAITKANLLKIHELDSTLLRKIDNSKKDVFLNEKITVYNQENKRIYTNNDTINYAKMLPDLQATLRQVRASGEKRFTIGDMEIIGLTYQNKPETFVIIAGAIDTNGLANIKSLRQILISVYFITLLAVGVAGWRYSGRALKPISLVIRDVDKISDNNLDLRLNEGRKKDEIERLSITFNKMLVRLEKAFKVQKTFIAHASHELRNPLTKITSQLEVVLLNERDKEAYKSIISSVLEDIKKLNEISHRLLELAKLNSIDTELKFTLIRLDDLLWDARAEFLGQHPGSEVNFHLDKLPEDENKLLIKGNSMYLRSCFSNLMENACKFSPDETVTIKLYAESQQLIIKFEDNGVGIDKNDLPYVFEPFYRSKNSAYAEGYGIGLSIAHKIVLLHKGQIQVRSELNKGTTFTLIFPLP